MKYDKIIPISLEGRCISFKKKKTMDVNDLFQLDRLHKRKMVDKHDTIRQDKTK